MNLQNEILKLRQEVSILRNIKTVTNYQPTNPKQDSLWIDNWNLKSWDWKNWSTVSWWFLDFTLGVTFTVADYQNISWASWVLEIGTANWTSQKAISAGAFVLTQLTYFYRQDDNPNAIQTTITPTEAVQNWWILLAWGKPNPDTSLKATFWVFWWWQWSEVLVTGANIVANSITANKLSVNTLSAITADMGSITAGTITLDTNGYIRWGQTDFATWTGFFLGYNTADYKFSIWNPNNFMTWDWTYLKLKGSFDVWVGWLINNSSYTVANLPIAPTIVWYNNPSWIE